MHLTFYTHIKHKILLFSNYYKASFLFFIILVYKHLPYHEIM